MSNVVKNDKYIKADIDKNNNKFWYITLFDDATVLTEFGRVGKSTQSRLKDFPSQAAAAKFFDKKCAEKERDGRNGEIAYRKLDVIGGGNSGASTSTTVVAQNNLESVALDQIDTNSPETIKLIRYLTKVNAHNITNNTDITYDVDSGLFSTPCGIVTKSSLDQANDLLVELSDFVVAGDYGNRAFTSTASDYLMLIPQEVGRKLNLEVLFPDLAAIQKQKAILDSLEASLDSVLSGAKKDDDKPAKPQEKVFATKLHLVKDKKVIDRIDKKYRSTLNRGHSCSHLRVKTVYEVEIKSMCKPFIAQGKKIGNVMELWHGSRASNLLSILKSGLIVPPSTSSNVTGRLYGDGLYFSDQSSKATNYAYGYWGGGRRDNNCFVFLAHVAMGKPYVPKGKYGVRYPVHGYDSTYAKGGVSGVINNEMIVYKLNQANLVNLIELTA